MSKKQNDGNILKSDVLWTIQDYIHGIDSDIPQLYAVVKQTEEQECGMTIVLDADTQSRGERMIKWKEISKEKPHKTGMYKVKIDTGLLPCRCAYYDSQEDRWIDDDGCWLPADITLYITHWAED